MTDKTKAPELLPCPFCKGGETRIEPCGQTWRGQGYSDPQFYRLNHHGKLPQGDGFETCHILFRARTIHDIVSMWNTRADLSDAKDKRIEELEAKLAKALDALGLLVAHTHDQEKQLTEDLFHQDFCGESATLTHTRATFAELKGTD